MKFEMKVTEFVTTEAIQKIARMNYEERLVRQRQIVSYENVKDCYRDDSWSEMGVACCEKHLGTFPSMKKASTKTSEGS